MYAMSKKFNLVLAVALALGLLFAAAPEQVRAQESETTHVVSYNSEDWAFINDNGTTGDWSTAFVVGPGTPPLGTGSANIKLTSTSAGITLATQKYGGTKLSDITMLSYSTYTDASPAAITFQINYDPDLANGSEGEPWYGRLTYEPYMSGTAPTNGTWETWNMLAVNAKWWASPNGNSVVDEACPQSAPCTLSTLLTSFPNIGIRNDSLSAIQFKAGSGWIIDGYVDNFRFGTTSGVDVYDFELVAPTAVFVDDNFGASDCGDHVCGYDAFATIQAGIDAAANGATVNVAAGTYTEAIILNKPDITVKSVDGAASTIIDVPYGTLTTGVKVLANMGTVTFDGFTVKDFTEGGIIQGMSAGVGTVFHVKNNVLLPYNGYLRNGIQVSGNGSTVIGNTVTSAYLTEDWASTAILVVNANNVLVHNNNMTGVGDYGINVSTWNPITVTNITITNNTITGIDYPLGVIAYNNGIVSGVELHNNKVSDYISAIEAEAYQEPGFESYWGTLVENVDATENWWGSIAGPIDPIGVATYDPWCGDAACSFLNPNYLPTGVQEADIQNAISTAPSGSTIVIPDGEYAHVGAFTVSTPNLTIKLSDGTIIQNSSPCFVINADHTQIIAEPGAKCIPTDNSNGIDVAADLTDIRVADLEIYPAVGAIAGDGIHFAGVVTDTVLVDNKIHNMPGAGIFFNAQPTGVIDIHGNLFYSNGGNGIEAGDFNVAAEYNSWGSYGGPEGTGGDGVSANVTFSPWTHADITVAPVISNTTSRVVTTLANVSGRPTVLKDGNIYHMWYGPDDTHLYHTSSTNPAEFPAGTLVTFTGGTPVEVASPAIIKETDGFKMIAYGADNSEFALYTSLDGTEWTKGDVVFDGTGKFAGFVKVDAPFLFKTGTGYRLYFQVKTGSGVTERYNIYAAESSTIDGTYALVNSGNPVLSPATDTAAWDGKYVMHPWVVQNGGTYYMWYSAHNGTNQRIGVATSADGLAWTKSVANPVIGPVGEPAVINDNGIWRIWYLGAGNTVKYQSALNPLDLRQTLAYQVTANLVNVIAADVTLNFPKDLLSIAEITPGIAFNSVSFNTTTDGSIQFIGDKLSTPVEPVTGEDVVLFTVAFHTDAQGSGEITFGPATFGMPGVGSSTNVYLAAPANTASAQVNELPTLATTFGDAYYLVDDAQTFQVVITNKSTAYANAELRLGVPEGVGLTLNTTGYTLTGGVVDLGTLEANETVTLEFSATISSAGAKTISFDVYDGAAPDGLLLFATVETATVYTKPVISSTDITGPYQQGVAKNFTVNVNNVDSMYTPNSFTLHFNFPEGTTLVFGSETYNCTSSGCDVPVTLAVPANALTFTVTFNAAWNATATVTLIDGEVNPDRTLATFTTATNVVVYANIAEVKGTVSMQGRIYRGGVLFTLTGPSGFTFGPYSATSIDQTSNNVVFANLASGTYTITVTQPRYLNVTAGLEKVIDVALDQAIDALELKGGNADWTDNVIDVDDASVVGAKYGTGTIADDADVNFDNRVNIFDLALVGGNYTLTSATAYGSWVP